MNKWKKIIAKVINAILEKKEKIPFNQTKITRLLKEALVGNNLTTIIYHSSGLINPAAPSYLNIQKYASLKETSTTLRRNYQPPMELMLSCLLGLKENLRESENKKKMYEDLLKLNRININNIKEENGKVSDTQTLSNSPSNIFLNRNFSQ